MTNDAMQERAPALLSARGNKQFLHMFETRGRWSEGVFDTVVYPPRKTFMKSKTIRGFSLLELLIAVAIGFTFATITFVALKPLFNQSHLDLAYDTTLMALRNTRHLAITQSHQYYVSFNPAGYPAGTIEIQYQPPTVGGVVQPLQLVNTYSIPSDVAFAVQAGFPTNSPDGFGAGITGIDFGYGPGQTGAANTVSFGPDGGSYDANGNYNSGVLYLTRPSDPTIYSSRAVTVFGATGRVRGWRLYQQAGAPIWVQQ
jgi:prepilin-type N-terminal cleavage/methylation domain-containing protein